MIIDDSDFFDDTETDHQDTEGPPDNTGGGSIHTDIPPHYDHSDHSDHSDSPVFHGDTITDQPPTHSDAPLPSHTDTPHADTPSHSDHGDATHSDTVPEIPDPPVHTDTVIEDPPIPHSDDVVIPPPEHWDLPPGTLDLDVVFEPGSSEGPEPFNTGYRVGEGGVRRKSYRVYNNETDFPISCVFENIPNGMQITPNPVVVYPGEWRVFVVELSTAYLNSLSIGRTTKSVGIKLITSVVEPGSHIDVPPAAHGDHWDDSGTSHSDHMDQTHADSDHTDHGDQIYVIHDDHVDSTGTHGDQDAQHTDQHIDHSDGPNFPSEPEFELIVSPEYIELVFDPQTRSNTALINASVNEILNGEIQGRLTKADIGATVNNNYVRVQRQQDLDGTTRFIVSPNYNINPLAISQYPLRSTITITDSFTGFIKTVEVSQTYESDYVVRVPQNRYDVVGDLYQVTINPEVYRKIPGITGEQEVIDTRFYPSYTVSSAGRSQENAYVNFISNETGERGNPITVVSYYSFDAISRIIGLPESQPGDELTGISRFTITADVDGQKPSTSVEIHHTYVVGDPNDPNHSDTTGQPRPDPDQPHTDHSDSGQSGFPGDHSDVGGTDQDGGPHSDIRDPQDPGPVE